jgi:hypothetical protein
MVVAASRRNYATERVKVEDIITALHAPVEAPAKPAKDKPKVDEAVVLAAPSVRPSKPTERTEEKVSVPKSSSRGTGQKTNSTERPPRERKAPTVRDSSPRDSKPAEESIKSIPKVSSAEELRAVLAKIAADTGKKPDASSMPTPETPKPAVPRDALRSVLGKVLETALPDTKPATLDVGEPSSTAEVVTGKVATEPTVPPTPSHAAVPEIDPKTLKKILAGSTPVKPPL